MEISIISFATPHLFQTLVLVSPTNGREQQVAASRSHPSNRSHISKGPNKYGPWSLPRRNNTVAKKMLGAATAPKLHESRCR
ncbi:Protein transport protein [Dirofilaria immitis]